LFPEVIDLRFQSVELFLGRIVSGPRADLEVIPAWAEIGRERRANAGRPPFCEPKLGGRGDAERTVLTGGVPARSAMIPVLTRGVRALRRHP